jgi:hypothetical protein
MSAETHEPDWWMREGRRYSIGALRRRVVFSIGACAAWVSLTLLYVAFWAHGFTLFQSIAVIFASLVILFAALLGAWVSYGLRFAGRWDD